MITLRPSQARGYANHGWLKSYHSFSFANYYDPNYLGWRSLRVINEDRVSPGAGFDTHGHRDMEIITYVLEGSLEHKDSLGNGSIIKPGEIQRMSAGTGIFHSEYNASPSELVHFLQIWILPSEKNLEPSYEQQAIATGKNLQLLASSQPTPGALKIHQDVSLYRGLLAPGDRLTYPLAPNRYPWIQMVRGSLQLEDLTLSAGDGAAIEATPQLELVAQESQTEFLLFDLA
jgi:redox-sensitive bicupin YhaK (pirin superfamily)